MCMWYKCIEPFPNIGCVIDLVFVEMCMRVVVVFLAVLLDVSLPLSDPFIKGTLCVLWDQLSTVDTNASFSHYEMLLPALLCLIKVREELRAVGRISAIQKLNDFISVIYFFIYYTKKSYQILW